MYNTIWYDNLTKPFLTPPAWIFAPVWIILYAMIFVALLLFTIKRSSYSKIKGYSFFIIQMALNLVWSPVFFLNKNIKLALIIIILMDICTFFNIKYFAKVSETSAIILIPYLIWILFATYLNLSFLILNVG